MSETTTTQEPEAPAVGDDLESVLTAAYNESMAKAEAEEAGTPSERPRDESGRFAKAEGEAPAAEAKDEPSTDQPKDTAPDRPESWSETEWQALTPEARETVARRERDMHAALVDRATENQELDRYRQAYAPHEARMREAGITHPSEALERLLGWEDAVRRDPANAIPRLAAAVGFDLRTLSPSDPSTAALAPPVPMRDPRVDQMLEANERAERARVEADIAAFKADSKNQHFETVRPVMAQLVQANPSMTLAQAYEAAVWADPKIRAEQIAKERAAAQAELKTSETRRAKEARAASVSVADSADGGNHVNGVESWRKYTLEEELGRNLMGRVS